MKYSDGKSVSLGDKVDLGGGMTGVVVAVIEEDEYSEDYPAAEWSYLSVGLLVQSLEGGLIHYPHAVQDVVLLQRARDKPDS